MKNLVSLILKKIVKGLKKVKTISIKLFKRIMEYFNYHPKTKAFFLIVFLILFLFLGASIGRYIYYEIRDAYFSSKNFYFNSDKLGETLSRYRVDNWSGADTYVITFNMNSYKNNSVYTTSDIPYSIDYSCSTNVTCQSTKANGTILSSNHTDSFAITITPAVTFSDGDNIWLEVEASSISPYNKTLSGRFVISIGKIGLSYEIIDDVGSPYLDLSVTNTLDYYLVNQSFGDYEVGHRLDISTYLGLSAANKEKCTSAKVKLNFNPNTVRLDMTNEKYLNALTERVSVINTYNYISGFDFKIDALSSETVRFYKTNINNDYTYPFESNTPVINVVFE